MNKFLYNFYRRLIKSGLSVFLFWPLAVLYYCVFILRKLFYRLGIRKSRSLPCQVISIGNLTWGGTGKTPLVELIAQKLKLKRIVILSRGYGRRYKKEKIIPVSDESRILADIEYSGDEPYLLANKLPGRPVIVGANRTLSAKWAISRFHPEIIILDDGFQHWPLKRNLDIVIINSANPFGSRWLIPAGILREPRTELKRAQIIFLSKVNEGNNKIEHLKKEIRKFNPHAPIIESILEPVELSIWKKGENRPKEFIQKKRIFMLASIASPSSFRYSLLKLGANLAGEAIYPDHYSYQPVDLNRIRNLARLKGAEFIVTTEKDKMRLPVNTIIDLPILILKVRMKVIKGEETLNAWLS